MKLHTVLVLVLVLALALAACGSSPVATPADASQDAVHIADATDAPTDPCGGLCGAGTICVEGRCVAVDAGVDAPIDVLLAEDRGFDVATDTGCPAHAERLPSGGCACVIGYQLCGGVCRELDTDSANCGACGNVCDGGVCMAGRCMAVAPTDASADVPADDGAVCASMTPGNCCGIACVRHPTASAATCIAGRCGQICAAIGGVPVTGDCDGVLANGCEVDLRTSAANCGACGAPCAPGRVCAASACGACAAGLADCDRDAANGCESRLAGDVNNCGVCGHACGPGFMCMGGACSR